jgi:hypothetical protein
MPSRSSGNVCSLRSTCRRRSRSSAAGIDPEQASGALTGCEGPSAPAGEPPVIRSSSRWWFSRGWQRLHHGSQQRGGLAGGGAGTTDGAAGGWRSQRPLGRCFRKQCGRVRGNSRPYRYLDVTSSRRPRDLVKDRKFGESCVRAARIGRIPVKDWAQRPEGKST